MVVTSPVGHSGRRAQWATVGYSDHRSVRLQVDHSGLHWSVLWIQWVTAVTVGYSGLRQKIATADHSSQFHSRSEASQWPQCATLSVHVVPRETTTYRFLKLCISFSKRLLLFFVFVLFLFACSVQYLFICSFVCSITKPLDRSEVQPLAVGFQPHRPERGSSVGSRTFSSKNDRFPFRRAPRTLSKPQMVPFSTENTALRMGDPVDRSHSAPLRKEDKVCLSLEIQFATFKRV